MSFLAEISKPAEDVEPDVQQVQVKTSRRQENEEENVELPMTAYILHK